MRKEEVNSFVGRSLGSISKLCYYLLIINLAMITIEDALLYCP